jgi:hypothetical protein
MSAKELMTHEEIKEMQRKIDQGILLAQQRLVARAKRDNSYLVFSRNGQVIEVPANEL